MHKKYLHARMLSAMLAFSMVASATPLNTNVNAADGTVNKTVIVDEENDEGAHKVTYDYATNGGTSSDVTYGLYDEGETVNLSPTAVKEGWTFVGWNTDKDAKEAMPECTVNKADLTLYAIFKKDVQVKVHYATDASGKEGVLTTKYTFYNNVLSQNLNVVDLLKAAPAPENWEIAGITGVAVTDEKAVAYSTDDIAGFLDVTNAESANSIQLTADGPVEAYVVYKATPAITYNDDAGNKIEQKTSDVFYIAHATCEELPSEGEESTEKKYDDTPVVNISTVKASFTLADGPSKDGYNFAGWKLDGVDTVYKAGDKYAEKTVAEIASNPLVMTASFEEQKAESVQMSAPTARVKMGETIKLEASVLPENTLNKNIVWSSSDEKIAKVDDKGVVTPVAEGKVKIIATAEGTEVSNYTDVEVTAADVETLSVTYDTTTNGGERDGSVTIEVNKGDKADLTKKANKTGYEFVGWNTDKNAKEAMKEVVVNEDTTLYAIYKKEVTISIITQVESVDNKITFFNNEKEQKVKLPNKNELFGGVYAVDAVSPIKTYDEDKIINLGSEITVTPADVTYYAVYNISSKVTYKTPLSISKNKPADYKTLRENEVVYHFVGNETIGFKHVVPSDIEPAAIDGYEFLGWAVTAQVKDAVEPNKSVKADDSQSTTNTTQESVSDDDSTKKSSDNTTVEPWTNLKLDYPDKISNSVGKTHGFMKYKGHQMTTEDCPNGYYSVTFDMECVENPKSLKTFSVDADFFDKDGKKIGTTCTVQFSEDKALKTGSTYKSRGIYVPDETVTIKFYSDKLDSDDSKPAEPNTPVDTPEVVEPTVNYDKLYKAGDTIETGSTGITVEAVYKKAQAETGDAISISPENPTLNVGDKKKMEIKIVRKNYKGADGKVQAEANVIGDYEVKFLVADSKIAVIDGDGIVTAKAKGSTKLTVEAVAKDGTKLTKSTTITVTDVEDDKEHENVKTGVPAGPLYGGILLMLTGLIGGIASIFGFRRKKDDK